MNGLNVYIHTIRRINNDTEIREAAFSVKSVKTRIEKKNLELILIGVTKEENESWRKVEVMTSVKGTVHPNDILYFPFSIATVVQRRLI